MSFIHLRTASAYSLKYGTTQPRDLVARASELEMPALALTDRDGMAELGAHPGVRRLEVGLLHPARAAAHVDIRRAGAVRLIVGLVADDAAALVGRSDDQRVTVTAHRGAPAGVPVKGAAAPEVVLRLGIGRLEIRELRHLHAGG